MINLKYPCKHCKKSCKSNQKCMLCVICNTWFHLKCTSLTLSQFSNYKDNISLPFYCNHCLTDILPVNCLEVYCPEIVQDSLEYMTVDNLEAHYQKSRFCDDDILILHINIKSLTKHIDKIFEFLSSFLHLPDIIAITESKLHKNNKLDLIQIPGYKFNCNNSLSNFGGTALYIKSSINFKLRTDINFL